LSGYLAAGPAVASTLGNGEWALSSARVVAETGNEVPVKVVELTALAARLMGTRPALSHDAAREGHGQNQREIVMWKATIAMVGLLALTLCLLAVNSGEQGNDPRRIAAVKAFKDGNFKEAYDNFRLLAIDPKSDPELVPDDLKMGLDCLARLGRLPEWNTFIEESVAAHGKNWMLLQQAAEAYANANHWGFMIAGNFERGHRRGGGRQVSSAARDRVRGLQLMRQGMDHVAGTKDRKKGMFYMTFASLLMAERSHTESFRLQSKTDLAILPDYEDMVWGASGAGGIPSDAEGNPIFYGIPESFEAAKNDGERWRYCLLAALEMDASLRNTVLYAQYTFAESQFGIGMAATSRPELSLDEDGNPRNPHFALHTLSDEESIVFFASGLKRVRLVEDYNPIKLLYRIADEPKTGLGEVALDTLASTYESRRQFTKAASILDRAIKEYGTGNDHHRRLKLEQIRGKWARFGGTSPQPAGEGAKVVLDYRNASDIDFEAYEIKSEELIGDIKAYIKSNPREMDSSKIHISNIGHQLVYENETKYLGKKVAQWSLGLNPGDQHWDKRVTVATPVMAAGAYLLKGSVAGGNTTWCVLWIADTVLIRKQLTDNRAMIFVGDAVDGRVVSGANVEFFGYRFEHSGKRGVRPELKIQNFAETSDKEGLVVAPADSSSDRHQWLIIARTKEGRLAYLGFQQYWGHNRFDQEYNQTKTFVMTDRPVYRPEQTVQYKAWIGNAKYGQPEESVWAGKEVELEIFNPKGERIQEAKLTTDAYGGISGSLLLPGDATLGVYRVSLKNLGGSSFRVEEYKKPEFEVIVEGPTAPVKLGEKTKATVKAKYYFGAPVTEGTVSYKILRTPRQSQWYASMPWDWMYGPGYWWSAYDYDWYPGFQKWGCRAPFPSWFGRSYLPPEVIAEGVRPLTADGTFELEIDTADAFANHPNQDHEYSVTAEVTDLSRRTIVGTGSVLVARKPFSVYAWLDRGYYRVGQTITASFQARSMDGKPVQGEGELSLLRLSYDAEGKPVEQVAQKWTLPTNEAGRSTQVFRAGDPGQYRLAYRVTRDGKETVEGGYIFTILGDRTDLAEFRFNALELIPDKGSYAPGEKVELQINTNHVNSTVLLFTRAANSVYLKPVLLRLSGKSMTFELPVVTKDMPNFYVEAITVFKGQVHTVTKEIVVPPSKETLDIEVVPAKDSYKPGEEGHVEVRVRDTNGRPFKGSLVLTMYDRALEAIAGGSNVPEIKAFFWKWRRHHSPQSWTSLNFSTGAYVRKGDRSMEALGSYGGYWGPFGGGMASDGFAQGGENGRLGMVTRGAPTATAAMAPGAPMSESGRSNDAIGAYKKGEVSGDDREQEDAGDAAENSADANAVRSNFADTALWVAELVTDSDGIAKVSLTMPDNLTGWRVKAWGMGPGTRVGQGEAIVVTRKDLMVRLQAPRFFVEKDEVVLSAIVHNDAKEAKSVLVNWEWEGGVLTPMTEPSSVLEVPAGQQVRMDLRVKVIAEGQALVRVRAETAGDRDAVQMSFPAFVHGMLKTESWSLALAAEQERSKVTIRVPQERRIAQSELRVQYSPTLAGAMVDALPYLVSYPYGCTEQTLNRFLPTVMTQKVLLHMGLDLPAIKDKRTNLNAQEVPGSRRVYEHSPVFDQDEVQKMVKVGLARLGEMQLSDGGWGWFSGYGERSYPHTTAYVVHGLQMAVANDVAVVPDLLERGIQWLRSYEADQLTRLRNGATQTRPYKLKADNLDAFVHMVLVDAGVVNTDMADFLYRDRVDLAVYTKAMFGLSLHKRGEAEKLAMIRENILQYMDEDEENQTAHLKLPSSGYWWYWYGSEHEAHAYTLKLLTRTEPTGRLTARLAKYLVNNRQNGTYWKSTRDTALCVEALGEFVVASGEGRPDMTIEVWVNGSKQKEVAIKSADLFTFDNAFVLKGDAVLDGDTTIELVRRGKGPVYWNVYLTNFTLEDPIAKAGLEIKVEREFYRLVPEDKATDVAGAHGQVVKQKVEKYRRERLENLSTLKSGELVEIELTIDSKNDYEYLMFEDMKAAGFEPVEVRSGYNGNDLGAYMELRDTRVTFFVRWLARGKHSVRYRMRAEIPGRFSALPTRAEAMYAPELKANSDEWKAIIID
jgi:uncharacterized protein YfaS (alpha-2-macroglobulin family)